MAAMDNVMAENLGAREAMALSHPLQDTDSVLVNRTWPRKIVQSLGSCRARAAIVLFWVVLAASGLAVFKSFVKGLESQVPPCAGTDSKLADDKFKEYFPAVPLSGAFLIRSRDRNTKLLDFADRSTCEIELTKQDLTSGRTAAVTLACYNASALGGGCLRNVDLEPQLDKLALKLSKQILPVLGMNASEIARLQKMMVQDLHEMLAPLMRSLPNITSCPVKTAITEDWFNFTGSLSAHVHAKYPQYDSKGQSLVAVPNKTIVQHNDWPQNLTDKLKNMSKGLLDITASNITVEVPAGQFWQLFQSQFLADGFTSSLASVSTADHDVSKVIKPFGPIAEDIGMSLSDICRFAPGTLNAEANSLGQMLHFVKQGIDKTMKLSASTVPLALLILAGMVQNLRLLLIVLSNLAISISAAILFMFPFTKVMTTATTAPSLMIAVALAMSIDYSLFLLSRFRKEIAAGRAPEDAVAVVLCTSGRIVLVSGLTLLLCFLMMLCLPVSFVYSMGVAAAITVFMAVSVSLTLTPTLLLTCPNFFSNNRRWGLTTEGCCSGGSSVAAEEEDAPPLAPPSEQQDRDIAERQAYDDAAMIKSSCWPGFGSKVQRGAWIVAAALVAVAVPVAFTSLPQFKHSVGLLPMMPTDASSTHTLIDLQNSFGVGTIFPTQLVVVPNPGETSDQNRTRWLQNACDELGRVADAVNAKMDPSLPPFTSKAFTGVMLLDGRCTVKDVGAGVGGWSNVGHPYSATKVMISYPIDPFSTQGQQWIISLRDAIDTPSAKRIASWYVYGAGPIQMDASNLTFARLPLMVSLMMCVVFVVIAIAFKSFVAPLRAVFCLMWMLVVTYGIAIYTYQNGLFDFLNWSQLGQRESGAMSWLSPAMAGSMMVGLGLDYDIFYSERVVEEWEHGYDEKTAAARALGATANVISAAGLIMVVAFLALMVSTTPVLNEIGFLLCVSVVIDCFITTKVIIPCAMALLGPLNFWPRKQPGLPQHSRPS